MRPASSNVAASPRGPSTPATTNVGAYPTVSTTRPVPQVNTRLAIAAVPPSPKTSRDHLTQAVEQEKTVLNRCVFRVRETEVITDRGLQHRERLTIDVVDNRCQKHQADDQPAQARNLHRIAMPPLISMVSAVMKLASSPARNAMTAPTSSGSPARPRGIVLTAC